MVPISAPFKRIRKKNPRKPRAAAMSHVRNEKFKNKKSIKGEGKGGLGNAQFIPRPDQKQGSKGQARGEPGTGPRKDRWAMHSSERDGGPARETAMKKKREPRRKVER